MSGFLKCFKRTLLLFCFALTTLVQAQTDTDGQEISQQAKKARQGDPHAQFALGMRYYLGVGVEENPRKAAYWFLRGAIQGDPINQFAIGLMYKNGHGVDQDAHKAKKYLDRACASGSQVACKESMDIEP